MQRQITDSFLQELREIYTPGTKVRLLKMDDAQAPPLGTIGKVRNVDDLGTIHISWESGGGLGVVWGEDKIVLVDKVITICKGEKRIWEKKEIAIEFFAKAMIEGKGDELWRYFYVICNILLGFTVCTDKKTKEEAVKSLREKLKNK